MSGLPEFNSGLELAAAKKAFADAVMEFKALAEETEMKRRHRKSEIVAISKVREQVRAVHKNSYTPHDVPIGPHHINCSSQDSQLEKTKLHAVGFMQIQSEKNAHASATGGLAGLAEALESEAREFYADEIGHMTPGQFSRMLLHDGCYLLIRMVEYGTGNANNGNPQGPTASSNGDTGMRDTMYLLENQIPFLVLEKIHCRVKGVGSSPLQELEAFVQKLLVARLYISPQTKRRSEMPSHLLHLVHTYFHRPQSPVSSYPSLCSHLLPIWRKPKQSPARTGRWHRATEYCRLANVQFKCRDFNEDEEWTILDVSLDCAWRWSPLCNELWIPCLRVDNNTWTILRNLMALEEQQLSRHVTAYCIFMSQVACTAEDVEILVRAGVVEHFLGSDDEVARGFADLCKGVVLDFDKPESNYLKPMWQGLEELRKRHRQNFIGWFRQMYFRNTVTGTAFIIAVVVFFCQLLQTGFAVVGGVKESKH